VNIVRHSSFPLPVALLLISLTVLAILFSASSPIHILEIAYAEGGGRVFRTQINPGDHFSLGYIHSVQLSPVTDDFEIDQHHLGLFNATHVRKIMNNIGFKTKIYAGFNKKLWNKKMKSPLVFVGLK